jgi:hypothetical protein
MNSQGVEPIDASFRDDVGLTCDDCGRTFCASAWIIVDASVRPELILDDQLFSLSCPHCGSVAKIDYPLLLYLPDAEPSLLFSPPPGWEQVMVQDQVIELVEYLCEPLGSRWREEWLTEDLPVLRHDLLASAVAHPQAIERILEIEELLQQASDATDAYEHDGDLEQLPEALRVWTELWAPRLLDAVTADFRLCLLNDGAHAHMLRYLVLGDAEDLYVALDVWERAVAETPPGSGQRPGRLSNLGNGLVQRYLITAERAYLERAIALHRQALATADPQSASRGGTLSNLASALILRHARTGQQSDLDDVVELLREALRDIPDDSSDCPGLIANLGGALLTRFERHGAPDDLQEALSVCQTAMAASPSAVDLAAIARNLGKALWRRYQQSGCPDALRRAVSYLRQSVESATEGAPSLSLYLDSLGQALSDLYDATGEIGHLRAALDVYRRAADELSVSPVDQPDRLSNRGSALIALYAHAGDEGVLDEALRACRVAVRESPPDAPGRTRALNNLATALTLRYTRTGQLHDLEEAIGLIEAAVEATPSNGPSRHVTLNNLGNAVLRRYEHEGAEGDLERAIACYEEAVNGLPRTAPVRAQYLHNLANALSHRYHWREDRGDIARRLALHRDALAVTPADSPHRRAYLSGLGTAYLDRYAVSKEQEDLRQAVVALEHAVQGAATSPTLPGDLYNLGLALSRQYEDNHEGTDRRRAAQAFREACQQGLSFLPGVVLDAARAWSDLALRDGAWSEGAEACAYGLNAAERIYRAQLHRRHKQTWLRDARGIAANGAYALARSGERKQAVLTLEGDRARLLSEALERDRADLSQLRKTVPEAHGRYLACAERLRWLEAIDLARQDQLASRQLLREALAAAYDELQAIAAEIRGLPGHEGFLAPLCWDNLTPALGLGHAPLIYIAHTGVGGVALLVWSTDDISTLWLDELTHQRIEAQVFGDDGVSGYAAAYGAWRDDPSEARLAAWQETLASCIDWLRRVVTASLNATLCDRGVDRAVLVPTGLLTLLPLHAAQTEVAFAFAPNVRTVAKGPGSPEPHSLDRAMIVENPNPDGPLALPFAHLEVQGLPAHLPPSEHLYLAENEARAELVLSALTSYRIWHLATHAHADPREAMDSFLLLAHEEQVSLRDLLSVHAEADLVVLSACETGIPQMDVPDEVISLASGMLQAGARCVVSSLWAVNDLSTALLMDRFYHELGREQTGEPKPVAVALRAAQEWLRALTLAEARAILMEWMATSVPDDVQYVLIGQFIALAQRGDKPFAHPHYWAGFQAHGAAL